MNNIDAESVIKQYEMMNAPRNSGTTFDLRNYLNVQLGPNESSRTLQIRLLPFSAEETSPFHLIHTHSIKVHKEVYDKQFKNYVCLRRTLDINPELGHDCPICEINADVSKQLKELEAQKARGIVDSQKEKVLKELSFMTRKIDTWIVRCIERGKEDEGVKFWKFNDSKKKDGVYDKIINIFLQRKQESPNHDYNIFDLQQGKDLVLTLTKEVSDKGKVFTAVKVLDAGMPSPLSNDPNKVSAWVYDKKKWTDVYSAKPYGFLQLTVNGKVPIFDRNTNIWVDKYSIENVPNQQPTIVNNGMPQEEAHAAMNAIQNQFSNFGTNGLDNTPQNMVMPSESELGW